MFSTSSVFTDFVDMLVSLETQLFSQATCLDFFPFQDSESHKCLYNDLWRQELPDSLFSAADLAERIRSKAPCPAGNGLWPQTMT